MKDINKILKTLSIIIFLVAVFFFTKGKSYPIKFELVNNSKNIQTKSMQDFSGATLVNLDNDNDQEIFIAGYGASNLILKRNKDKFLPLQISELADSKGMTFSVTACDLDQDGRDEILILNRPEAINNTSFSRILKYTNEKWVDILPPSNPITKAIEFGYSSTCIDRKGDGKYGFAVSNENGKMSYLEMVNSEIKDIADEIGLGLKSKGRSVLGIPGPEGHTNIFEGNENGTNFYFVNNGKGVFTENALAVGLSDHLFNARGVSIIDINNDEIPDIVYGNNLGPTRLLEQSREGKFIDVTPEIMKEAYAVNSPVVGDFNLDGYEDVYLNNIRGHNKMFSHIGLDWFELDVGPMAENEMFGISTIAADLDKNGSYEILNTHGDGSHAPITLYTIKPVNKWLKFSAKYSNGTIPRGSIVILRTSKRNQVRVISSESGRFANYDSNEVIFGLLPDEIAKSAEIILPSGVRKEFNGTLKLASSNEFIISDLVNK